MVDRAPALAQRGENVLIDVRLRDRPKFQRGRADVEQRKELIVGDGRQSLPEPLRFLQVHRAPSLVMTRAGTPTAVACGGTSQRTTALAPIFTWSPIVTPPRIFAPAPMSTCPPTIGWPGSF